MKRILQYHINGKTLFFILKVQVDPIILGKLEHRPEYTKVKLDEDVIVLFNLLKETCNISQGGTMTDLPTKLIRSLRTLDTTKQTVFGGEKTVTLSTTSTWIS